MENDIELVWSSLNEFLKLENSGEKAPNGYQMHDVYYALELREMISRLIFQANGIKSKMYLSLCETARAPGNKSRFMAYKKALEREKEQGYKNLLYVIEKERNLLK